MLDEECECRVSCHVSATTVSVSALDGVGPVVVTAPALTVGCCCRLLTSAIAAVPGAVHVAGWRPTALLGVNMSMVLEEVTGTVSSTVTSAPPGSHCGSWCVPRCLSY